MKVFILGHEQTTMFSGELPHCPIRRATDADLPDVHLALAEAESAAVPMPSVNVVKDRLMTGIARGYAKLDWTALGLIAAEEAGAPVAQCAAP